MTDDSSGDEGGGIRRLLMRIGGRLAVVLALSVWIAWVVGGFGVLVIDPPLPFRLSISLRIDGQGIMIQKGRSFGRTSYVVFQESNSIPWQHLMSDIESTWLTQWIVVSAWTSGTFKYGLIGVRYGLLLPVSLIVVAMRYWLTTTHQRQKLSDDADNC